MSEEKLFSTGRTPSLTPAQVTEMLEFYFSDAKPTVPQVAERFPQTAKTGKHANVPRPMSRATVRKYLKAAGLVLPRGRANAAHLPRVAPASVRTLVNRIPTEMLVGKGRAELLVRLLGRGESIARLVTLFGISKGRIRQLRDQGGVPVVEAAPKVSPEASIADAGDLPAVSEPEPAPESPEEVNTLDGLEALEVAPEASEETPEA